MKVTTINLKGVVLSENDFPGKKVSVIVGENGKGKSSVAATPYWVLSGKTLTTRKGTTACEGSFELGGDVIRRHKTGGTTTLYFNGSKVTEKALEMALEQRRIPKQTLEAFFNPRTTLTAEDLLKATRVSLAKDNVLKLMALDVPEEVELGQYLDSLTDGDISLKDLKKAEKFFTDKRRELKKEVKTLEARISEQTEDEMALDSEDKRLQGILETLYERKGKSDAAKSLALFISQAQKECDSLKKQKTELNKVVALESASKTRIEGFKRKAAELDAEIKAIETEVNECETQISAKRGPHKAEMSKLVQTQAEISTLASTVDRLENVKECPLYSGMLCSADKSEAISALKQKLITLNQSAEQSQNTVSSLEKEIDAYSNKAKALQTTRQAKFCEKQNTEFSIKDEERLLVDIENAKKRLSEIQSSIEEKEKALLGKSSATIDDTVDEEIAKAKKEISDISIKKKLLCEQKMLEKEKANKSLDVGVADNIVKALKEVPETIFNKITAPLNKTANAIIKTLKPNWVLEFNVDGDVTINIGGEKFTREDLSGGEEVILNYCLKVIVAKLLALQFVFIDDCDRLDANSLQSLISTAQTAAKEGIGTVIVTSANIAPNPDVAVFKL